MLQRLDILNNIKNSIYIKFSEKLKIKNILTFILKTK